MNILTMEKDINLRKCFPTLFAFLLDNRKEIIPSLWRANLEEILKEFREIRRIVVNMEEGQKLRKF